MLNIENNLSSSEVPWDTLCFHALQATQKTMRAFLVYNDQVPDENDDTLGLFNKCIPFAPALGDLEGRCKRMHAFANVHRSLYNGREPEEEEALSLIGHAGEIQSRLISLMA